MSVVIVEPREEGWVVEWAGRLIGEPHDSFETAKAAATDLARRKRAVRRVTTPKGTTIETNQFTAMTDGGG